MALTPAPAPVGERLAKRMARVGLCSRREAEAWIAEGRVEVNGLTVTEQGLRLMPSDQVRVDGKPLGVPADAQVWAMHKPRGVLVTAKDPQGRRTIYDLLPQEGPRLMPVGRLDMSSEGLLLLTNDGLLKRRLELPETGLERTYRVRVYGRVSAKRLAALAEGTEIDGVTYGPIRAWLEHGEAAHEGQNRWLRFVLREGKNREIRKVCAHLGLQVSRLVRLSYGPVYLSGLSKGQISLLAPRMVRLLAGQEAQRRSGWAKAKPRPRKPGRQSQFRKAK